MKLLNIILTAIATCVALTTLVCAQSTHKSDFQTGKDWLAREYQAARLECSAYFGNAREVCSALAAGMAKTGNADLNARYTSTPKARYQADVAKAESDYVVARLRCQNPVGRRITGCLRGAKTTLISGRAVALQRLKSSDARGRVEAGPVSTYRKCSGQSTGTKRRSLNKAGERVHET